MEQELEAMGTMSEEEIRRCGIHSGPIKPQASVGGVPNYIGVGVDRA